jgi:X-Pro dipeptidyl-peptidase
VNVVLLLRETACNTRPIVRWSPHAQTALHARTPMIRSRRLRIADSARNILPATIAAVLSALAAAAPAADTPRFVDGQAQVVEEFADARKWIRETLWVETEFDSDGDGARDRMHVDVTRPAQTKDGLKVAVIYETSPYYAEVAKESPSYVWNPNHELDEVPPAHQPPPALGFNPKRTRISDSLVAEWVPRGFAVVHSESPGTGLSDGSPTCGGANEALAPKAVIDWLNGRARGFTARDGGDEVKATWSTGKVGMTGTSYNGTLCIAAATTGVEGLAAIIPVAPNTSYYRYYRANGLVRHPGGYMGEDMDVLYQFIHSGDPAKRDWANEHILEGELLAGIDRTTGDWNDFWKERDYWHQLDRVKVPTFLAHGLNDWNVMPSHSTHVYRELRKKGVPARLYLHQGGHGGDPPFEQMNRWFTRWLYEVDNGAERDPAFIIAREGGKRSEPTDYADWPNPAAAPVTLRPRAGGLGVGALVADAAPEDAKETITDDVAKSGTSLAKAAKSEHRLLYALPTLSAPLHLSGTPKLTIRLACDKPAANVSVWLVSLPWKGGRNLSGDIVTRGWADPRNHASIDRQEPLEAGRFYDLTFELESDDQIIAAGEQLALMIFSSDRDFTLWPKAGTKLTVDLAGTALELPVVGGAEAVATATAPADVRSGDGKSGEDHPPGEAPATDPSGEE